MAPVKQKTKAKYANKRRFYGNRFTNANKSAVSTPAAREHLNDVELENNISTASAAKIIPVITE